MPDNEFYDIIEDNQGYIWLAADKGLFRFDGVNYEKFQHPEQRGLSIFSLNKDENGTIWFVNISGQVFYIENEKMVLFGDYKQIFKGVLPNLSVSKHSIILYSKFQLSIFNRTTKKEVYNLDIEKDYGLIEPIVVDNYLYYATALKLIKLNLENLDKEEKLPILNNYSRYIQGSLFSIPKQDTLVYFTRSQKEGVEFHRLSKGFKNNIETLEDNFPNVKIIKAKVINNQLWYCTENGVYICELEDNKVVVKRHLFLNQFITNVVVDKHTNYWFTTLNNALFVVPNLAINTVNLDLQNDKIKAVKLGKQDELLINTINYKLHKHNVNSKEKLTYTYKGNPDIHYSTYHPFNNKYYSLTNLGIYEFNSHLKKEKTRITTSTLKDIYYVNNNKILFAYGSIVRIDEGFFKITDKKLYFKRARGYAVQYNTITKTSYFATIDGLFAVDENYKETEITFNGQSIYIKDIELTEDGTLWCSSFKNGLFAIKNNKVVKQYTTNNGLLSITNPLIKAKNNSLWIAGNNGIQYFNTTTETFKNLTKKEGIVSYNYNGLEIIADNVYVSSPEQLIYFNKKDVFKDYNTPEVYFSNISIANVKQPIESSYTLKEKASAIDIHFNAIGYKTSTSGKFEYRLIGLQNDWIESVSGKSNVQYNTLLEGDYTFQIRNVTTNNEDAVTKEIQFVVTKPFWEKLWFYALLSLLFFGIVTLFYRKKIKTRDAEKNELLKQLEANNELINLKLENLRSQMNPHFVFNALNSIQDYIISNQKDLAGDYLGKFADLIRTYLEHSTKGKLTLEEEITTLNMYLELEKLRFEDSLEYNIHSEKNIDLEFTSIPTMLIQPYVENALKHGLLHKKTTGKLNIHFSKFSEEIIQCIIEDNGIGREKSKQLNEKRLEHYKSFALKATNERLDLLNYGKNKKVGVQIIDLKSENNQALGTKIILKIPISK